VAFIIYKPHSMTELYTKNPSDFRMEPTKETIQFLLDFSKSLSIVKSKHSKFIELNLN